MGETNEAFPLNETTTTAPVQDSTGSTVTPGMGLLETVLASLDDSKAEELSHIDIGGKSALCDHLVVASGRSHRHVNAVSDRLMRDLKTAGHGSPKVEGMPACDWVLMDTGDVIVHIFRPEVREFYSLEKMWKQVATGPAPEAIHPLDA